MRPLILAVATLSLLTLTRTGVAQGELLTVTGPGSPASNIGRFGKSLDAGGYVDGDAHADILVGDPAWRRTLPTPALGLVEVRAGRSGSVIYSITDRTTLGRLGTHVANAGDVDNDGVDDVLMTADDFGAGSVKVVSGATGEVLHLLHGIGSTVARLGDIDDDDHADFIVGDPTFEASKVSVISGATGSVLWTLQGASGVRLGADVDGGADIDGDGCPDLLVVSRPSGAATRIQIYSGMTHALIHDVASSNPGGSFAVRGRFVGTLNADAVIDFALGESEHSTIAVYSGSDAGVLYTRSSFYGSQLGHDLAGVGDIDGDGHGDLLVGSPSAGAFGVEGQFRVYSGIDGALLLNPTFNGDGARGTSVAPAGDVDGDGLCDYAIGVPYADNGISGEVQIFSSASGNQIASFGTDFDGALGSSLSLLGDLDGDGEPELVAGNPTSRYAGFSAGRVTILSPATGDERHFDGAPARGMAEALAFVGDVNADGRDDFAIGMTNTATGGVITGTVEVRSGLDGSLLLDLRGPAHHTGFGTTIAATGDLNGDGRDDIAVGAPFADDSQGTTTGAIHVYSGLDGSLLFERFGTNPSGYYGNSISGGQDADGDLIPDLLVGATFAQGSDGVVEMLSGADGALMLTLTGTSSQFLGSRVGWLGDVNNDGVPDFAVRGRATGAGSVIQVRSGADGALHYALITPTFQFYPASFACIGDVSGDGVPDLAIGLADEDPNGNRSGLVRIHAGSNGRILAQYVGAGSGATLGGEMAAGGDMNGDGIPDFVVSSPEENTVGALRAFDGGCLQAVEYCSANLHSGGTTAGIQALGLTSISNNDFTVVAVNGPPGKFCVFFYGPTQINTPFGDGRRCVGGNTRRLQPARQFDGAGRLERPLDFTFGPLSSGSAQVTAGSTWNFQGWFRDPMGPGGSGFNLTRGLSVTFCP